MQPRELSLTRIPVKKSVTRWDPEERRRALVWWVGKERSQLGYGSWGKHAHMGVDGGP